MICYYLTFVLASKSIPFIICCKQIIFGVPGSPRNTILISKGSKLRREWISLRGNIHDRSNQTWRPNEEDTNALEPSRCRHRQRPGRSDGLARWGVPLAQTQERRRTFLRPQGPHCHTAEGSAGGWAAWGRINGYPQRCWALPEERETILLSFVRTPGFEYTGWLEKVCPGGGMPAKHRKIENQFPDNLIFPVISEGQTRSTRNT